MGQKSSKQKYQWGAFPPNFHPPGGYGPNPPFIPQGYQPPPGVPAYPQFGAPLHGFIPPGVYGQAAFGIPHPQLTWLPQDKTEKRDRKGKRRAQSDHFPGGYIARPIGSGFSQPNNPIPKDDGPVIPSRRPSKPKTGRRRASTSAANSHSGHPPPLTNPQSTGGPLNNLPSHRPQTPFIPDRNTNRDDESYSSDMSDDDDYEPHRHTSSASSRSRHRRRRTKLGRPPRRSQSTTYPEITGRIDDVLRPLPPANRNAFGPTGQRPTGRLDNPLPNPPRDLYEMTPYKSLLTLPQTTALLTASYGTAQQQNASALANSNASVAASVTTVMIPPGGAGATVIPPGALPQPQQDLKKRQSTKKKKGMGGLFRALSKKGKVEKSSSASSPAAAAVPQPAKVQFIPVFVDKAGPSGGWRQGHQQAQASGRRSGSSDNTGHLDNADSRDNQRHHHDRHQDHDDDDEPDLDPQHPPDSVPLEFDQLSQTYAGFMNHSPHRVIYQNKLYPTATHLHEALRYLPKHPELAERIRLASNVIDVYPLSAGMEQYQREDWAEVFMDKMEDVLLHKFKQHANLREMLVSETGNRQLVYADVLDAFWGLGPDGSGQNQLGRVLMNVRERLRKDGGLR